MRSVIRTFLVGLALSACSGGDSGAPSQPIKTIPKLTTLSVQLASASVVAGQTTQATVSGLDQNGQPISTGAVAWSSTNPSIASVDATGRITALQAGATTIFAAASGLTASASLTVTAAPALTRLTVSLGVTSARSGAVIVPTVAGFDQFNAPIATGAITWSSSAPSIATIQNDGSVRAAVVGTATITARSGTVTGTASITVTPGAATRLMVSRSPAGVFSNWRFSTSPEVIIADAVGNRVSDDNGTVVRVSAPNGLIGSASATAVAGSANFTDLGVLAAVGTREPLSYSAAGLTGVADTVTVAPFSFGNGTRLVGSTVRPGRYRSVNSSTISCYWARLRNTTGSNDIIANDIGVGPRLLEVLSTDVALESNGCATWVEITGPVTSSRTAPFTDGSYLVGIDIEPGTWQATSTGTSCYWERMRNINGTNSTLANYFGSLPAVMTILPSDVAITVSRCGTWTRVP